MVGSRTATAIAGLAVGLLVSVAAWYVLDTLLVFLFAPFVPFLLRGARERSDCPPAIECPECGFATREPGFEFCPRDGRRLQ